MICFRQEPLPQFEGVNCHNHEVAGWDVNELSRVCFTELELGLSLPSSRLKSGLAHFSKLELDYKRAKPS